MIANGVTSGPEGAGAAVAARDVSESAPAAAAAARSRMYLRLRLFIALLLVRDRSVWREHDDEWRLKCRQMLPPRPNLGNQRVSIGEQVLTTNPLEGQRTGSTSPGQECNPTVDPSGPVLVALEMLRAATEATKTALSAAVRRSPTCGPLPTSPQADRRAPRGCRQAPRIRTSTGAGQPSCPP